MKTALLTSIMVILSGMLLVGFIRNNSININIEAKKINVDGKDFVVCVSNVGIAICPYN